MSEHGNLVKAKCDAFTDSLVKVNNFLLQLESKNEEPKTKQYHFLLLLFIA